MVDTIIALLILAFVIVMVLPKDRLSRGKK